MDTKGDRLQGRRGPWRLPRYLIAFVLGLATGVYVVSYYLISRPRMEEARRYNMESFLYEPFEEVAAHDRDLARHHRFARFYWPINKLDQLLFRSPGPVHSITWGLSSKDLPKKPQ